MPDCGFCQICPFVTQGKKTHYKGHCFLSLLADYLCKNFDLPLRAVGGALTIVDIVVLVRSVDSGSTIMVLETICVAFWLLEQFAF